MIPSRPMTATITNTDLADKIGVTHSMASRIRSGHRHPGLDTMARIRDLLGWPLDDQVAHRKAASYAPEFERRLVAHFGPEPENAE